MAKAVTCFFKDHLSFLNLDAVTVMGAVYPSTTKTAITYSGGTIKPGLQAGTAYQYAFNPREFWRRGLVFLENYCKAAKGESI